MLARLCALRDYVYNFAITSHPLWCNHRDTDCTRMAYTPPLLVAHARVPARGCTHRVQLPYTARMCWYHWVATLLHRTYINPVFYLKSLNRNLTKFYDVCMFTIKRALLCFKNYITYVGKCQQILITQTTTTMSKTTKRK